MPKCVIGTDKEPRMCMLPISMVSNIQQHQVVYEQLLPPHNLNSIMSWVGDQGRITYNCIEQ